MLACLAGFKKTKLGSGGALLSFVAVVDTVKVFALQFSTRRVATWDFFAKAVHAPADAPFPTAGRLTLQETKEVRLGWLHTFVSLNEIESIK